MGLTLFAASLFGQWTDLAVVQKNRQLGGFLYLRLALWWALTLMGRCTPERSGCSTSATVNLKTGEAKANTISMMVTLGLLYGLAYLTPCKLQLFISF